MLIRWAYVVTPDLEDPEQRKEWWAKLKGYVKVDGNSYSEDLWYLTHKSTDHNLSRDQLPDPDESVDEALRGADVLPENRLVEIRLFTGGHVVCLMDTDSPEPVDRRDLLYIEDDLQSEREVATAIRRAIQEALS